MICKDQKRDVYLSYSVHAVEYIRVGIISSVIRQRRHLLYFGAPYINVTYENTVILDPTINVINTLSHFLNMANGSVDVLYIHIS